MPLKKSSMITLPASLSQLREKLDSWTCLKLTNNRSQADAIMNVEERAINNFDSGNIALPCGTDRFRKSRYAIGEAKCTADSLRSA